METNICRVCLLRTEKLIPISETYKNTYNLAAIIEELSSTEVVYNYLTNLCINIVHEIN